MTHTKEDSFQSTEGEWVCFRPSCSIQCSLKLGGLGCPRASNHCRRYTAWSLGLSTRSRAALGPEALVRRLLGKLKQHVNKAKEIAQQSRPQLTGKQKSSGEKQRAAGSWKNCSWKTKRKEAASEQTGKLINLCSLPSDLGLGVDTGNW